MALSYGQRGRGDGGFIGCFLCCICVPTDTIVLNLPGAVPTDDLVGCQTHFALQSSVRRCFGCLRAADRVGRGKAVFQALLQGVILLVTLRALLRVFGVLVGRRGVEFLGHGGILSFGERMRDRSVPAQERMVSQRLSFKMEDVMATIHERRIVESSTEARQAEPGPSILALLLVSLGLAAVTLVAVWTFFFHS